jgi:uncharacterized protein YjbI with pentapeptide repeats
MIKFDVLNRFTGSVQFTAEIDCAEDTPSSIKLGLAVKWGIKRGADLRNAYLSGAYLRGADLRNAYLSGADLSGAYLRGAPKIENIHQAVYEAASAPGALDMGTWHNSCGTTHCRAGWVVVLAGDEGKALEDKVGTGTAAAAIYLASDPNISKFPSFYCSNAEALADMKARAEAEKAGAP